MTEKDKSKVVYTLLIAAFLVVAYNQFALAGISGGMVAQTKAAEVRTGQPEIKYNSFALQQAIDSVIPRGVPEGYGKELGVDYEKPEEALNIMAALDGDLYEDGKLKFSDMSSAAQKRYVNMGMSVACEFCCGATTLIQRNGQPACGCAHSAAMRGLMKYLLINTNMTDEQIMDEVLKVKSISFPQQMVQRYMEQSGNVQSSGITGQTIGSLPQQIGGC
ncbi:MAG: hypothetical protein HYW27_03905 [Candidatus Aenigmarchaeota archaeon]|nr:hypothetical protein [Candidatus Aenigmarchaeota archaeon]